MKMVYRRLFLFCLLLLVSGACFLPYPYTVAVLPQAQAQGLSEDDKARLRSEYDQLQQEIAQWQTVLDQTRAKKNTLQGDVTLLNAQIKQAEAQIKQKNLDISKLAGEINSKVKLISDLDQHIARGRDSLGKLIRQQNESDTYPLAAIVFSQGGLTDFFADASALTVISRGLKTQFEDIRSAKDQTQKEREALDQKKNAELDAKYVVETKKQQIASTEAEKKKLLTATKQDEKSYQAVLADKQRKAEQIRNALFDLRDAQGISFAKALEYAGVASQKTGVRAAFILAILSQESDLGKNIGSCLVTDLETGDGVGKNSGTPFQKVMKAPRDTVPFQQITSAVGLNPLSTPVSCPLGTTYSSSRGYGGAMGPSQFIPSTWLMFEDRLRAALGVSQPNPWQPQDAIMATALYLSDLGADSGTYTGERNAACRYYSGRSCDSRRPTNYTYGDSVISKAKTFQDNIDFLKSI